MYTKGEGVVRQGGIGNGRMQLTAGQTEASVRPSPAFGVNDRLGEARGVLPSSLSSSLSTSVGARAQGAQT